MRIAKVERKTKETEISVELNIDGKGEHRIDTGIPFLDHMLSLMSRHGLFDLTIKAKGDIEVDFHHTVEDVGIVLGEAFIKGLGDKKGIKRYGYVSLPMDETLVTVAVDISNRPCLVYNVQVPSERIKFSSKDEIKEFDIDIIEDFFMAFVNNSRITLHINLLYGRNNHHIIEAVFKAFGKVIQEAAGHDSRIMGVLSTKEML
ncbi:MAG: imidazoleglycerol-phosphate dehydratase HisB [Nitrospirota bacterium]